MREYIWWLKEAIKNKWKDRSDPCHELARTRPDKYFMDQLANIETCKHVI